ncbi:CotH kinase family protein [Candidatus Saccharibacteria bacterium]|nr:CotH kinase family protein [Candidatus Saccharibacteria bacterium]
MDEERVEEEKKKAAPKKSSAKKSAPKKASTKKSTSKKKSTKKTSPKKVITEKAILKKGAVKKSTSKKKISVSDKTSEKSEVKVAVPKKPESKVEVLEPQTETMATVPIWRTEKQNPEKLKTQSPHPNETIKPVRPKKRYRKWPVVLMAIVAVLAIIFAVLFVLWNIGPAEDIKVEFSKGTGLYDTDIEVELSSNGAILSPATEIRYTLNGDDPIINGKVYTDSIKLGMSELINVIPIRATYCYVGGKCGEVYESTYILAAEPEKDITLDVVSITVDHKSLYDYETGIFVPGKTYDENIIRGTEQNGEYTAGNYDNRDDEWIRDANVVLLSPGQMEANTNKGILWNQKIGIQVSGGASATSSVKSLKLVANEKYGYEKLAYSFSPSGDSTKGLVVPKKYNSLRLRMGGQDRKSGNIRSSVASRLAEESGFDSYSATKRAIVYLNGKFYGIADVQQNYSNSFLKKRFGLANSDDIVKIKGKEKDVFLEMGLKGLFENDLDVEENREMLELMVDMDDYLMYYALNLLWNNVDWPQNNYEIWKYSGKEVSDNKYSDGRWRFLSYDLDLIYARGENSNFFSGVISDQFEAIMEDKYLGEDSTFPRVMESTYYRNKFIQIMQELMNGPFVTENVLSVIDEEANKIAPAMRLYYGRDGYGEWQDWVNLMKRAATEQNQNIKQDMYTYFKVTI